MRIFGKTLGEYARFAAGPLALTVVVGVLRFGLYQAGAVQPNGQPSTVVKALSITVVSLIAVLYYAIRVPTSGFGGVRQLLPLSLMQMTTASWIAGLGVVLGIATGSDNVFTRPEYSGGPGVDGKTWAHAGAHFVAAPIIAGVALWLVGSVVLLAVRRATVRRPPPPSEAAPTV